MVGSMLQSVLIAQSPGEHPANTAVEHIPYKPLGGSLYRFDDGSVLDVNPGGRFAFVSMDDYQAHIEYMLMVDDLDTSLGMVESLCELRACVENR